MSLANKLQRGLYQGALALRVQNLFVGSSMGLSLNPSLFSVIPFAAHQQRGFIPHRIFLGQLSERASVLVDGDGNGLNYLGKQSLRIKFACAHDPLEEDECFFFEAHGRHLLIRSLFHGYLHLDDDGLIRLGASREKAIQSGRFSPELACR